MKLLTKLEKSKAFWYLLGLSLLFFLLRLPSLIEPNWYGDEGIYQVIGLAINKGQMLYSQIWDNKPPMLYIVYALFHGDQYQVRLFSLISGLLTVVAFFYLSRLLFKQLKTNIISTLFFVLLFATPLLEGNIANAENFMLLLTISAGLLIYMYSQSTTYKILNTKYLPAGRKGLILGVAGLLLGIAFLFKIIAVFDLAAFCTFLIAVSAPNHLSLRGSASWRRRGNPTKLLHFIRNDIAPLLIAFLLPISITVLYFLINHSFTDFSHAVFSSNINYVGWKNNFIIPQGFLILKLALLGLVVFYVLRKRKIENKSSMFITLWLAFSIFNTFFSGRPYTHYTLVTIPSLCLLLGLIFSQTNKRAKYSYLLILLCVGFILCKTFRPNLIKTFRYYTNAITFLSGKKSTATYQAFFDKKTPRDYEIASFIKTHTNDDDNVFIWGDSAQIYALSGKIPPGKYTVAYHISQYNAGLAQTQDALNKTLPKYIITLPESHALPFHISTYETKFVFKGVSVYERNL